jgi:hypothetical protein
MDWILTIHPEILGHGGVSKSIHALSSSIIAIRRAFTADVAICGLIASVNGRNYDMSVELFEGLTLARSRFEP